MELEYRCVNGHDLCAQSYPGPDCPYCEVKKDGAAKPKGSDTLKQGDKPEDQS